MLALVAAGVTYLFWRKRDSLPQIYEDRLLIHVL